MIALAIIIVAQFGSVAAGIEVGELIGLAAPSRQAALEALRTQAFPLTITLRNGDDGERLQYVIPSLSKLPYRSVPSRCPNGKYKIIGKCWFVKYGD